MGEKKKKKKENNCMNDCWCVSEKDFLFFLLYEFFVYVV